MGVACETNPQSLFYIAGRSVCMMDISYHGYRTAPIIPETPYNGNVNTMHDLPYNGIL